MKSIFLALFALVGLSSCTVSVGPDGKPIVGVDGVQLAEIINERVNERLREVEVDQNSGK